MEKFKICPVCGMHNKPNMIECLRCETDLTSVKATDEETEKAKSIAFRLAEARLQAVSSQDYESKRIQYILENSEPDVVTIREIAEAIFLHNTGKVKLKLKNGQIYEGRENICQN